MEMPQPQPFPLPPFEADLCEINSELTVLLGQLRALQVDLAGELSERPEAAARVDAALAAGAKIAGMVRALRRVCEECRKNV